MALVAVLALGVIVFFERAVAAALARITGVMARLADDDLSADVAGRERADEIGAIGQDVSRSTAVSREAVAGAMQSVERVRSLEEAARQAAVLRSEVDHFLDGVRAA